ncbi:DUF6320 domain-containing protein [Chitinophaga sp. GCM10012297]|uniref:Zinc ribbon domain-containing protein n=1 Tax=Chitinophaga chungangae TaxID=2821488 RepID=A0ABS3YCI6_9BACT|nr:DUF6320 domain-containing protein [Chitinophaga chungangae]MBO9152381.1 zinc ribbon domain-containing protein [Chitinophaga chungangae]
MYCKNCGVELEDDMPVCPLCGKPVNGPHDAVQSHASAFDKQEIYLPPSVSRKRKKFTWEIVSLALGSGIVAAFIVDFIISHGITWSEYTTGIGVVIFCYVSVFAFWNKDAVLEIAGGFILSGIFLFILDIITSGVNWAFRLAIPLLLCLSVIAVLYIMVVRSARYKGINLIAYAFLGAALLCLCTEAIISHFRSEIWRLSWSVIVSACLAPVVMVLLFIHFRLKKGRDLERAFHI